MIDADFVRAFSDFVPNVDPEGVNYFPRASEGTYGAAIHFKVARKLPLTKEDLTSGFITVPSRSARWNIWDMGELAGGELKQGGKIVRASGETWQILGQLSNDGFGAIWSLACERMPVAT